MNGVQFVIMKTLTDFLNAGMNIHGRIQEIVAVDLSTGLKDKHGKEIYENDILKHSDDDRLLSWLVLFKDGCFGIRNIGIDGTMNHAEFYAINSPYYFIDREIIGNVHQNPELLK